MIKDTALSGLCLFLTLLSNMVLFQYKICIISQKSISVNVTFPV